MIAGEHEAVLISELVHPSDSVLAQVCLAGIETVCASRLILAEVRLSHLVERLVIHSQFPDGVCGLISTSFVFLRVDSVDAEAFYDNLRVVSYNSIAPTTAHTCCLSVNRALINWGRVECSRTSVVGALANGLCACTDEERAESLTTMLELHVAEFHSTSSAREV